MSTTRNITSFTSSAQLPELSVISEALTAIKLSLHHLITHASLQSKRIDALESKLDTALAYLSRPDADAESRECSQPDDATTIDMRTTLELSSPLSPKLLTKRSFASVDNQSDYFSSNTSPLNSFKRSCIRSLPQPSIPALTQPRSQCPTCSHTISTSLSSNSHTCLDLGEHHSSEEDGEDREMVNMEKHNKQSSSLFASDSLTSDLQHGDGNLIPTASSASFSGELTPSNIDVKAERGERNNPISLSTSTYSENNFGSNLLPSSTTSSPFAHSAPIPPLPPHNISPYLAPASSPSPTPDADELLQKMAGNY